MAGQIIVSNIKTDSDNAFSILANTGAVLFSANLESGITTNIANTRITGNIVSSQITSVSNTQITGTITASQIAAVNANTITSGSIPLAQVPRLSVTKLPTGSVLQVVQAVKTDTFSTTSTLTYVDVTGVSVSITPTSATSNVLVTVTLSGSGNSGAAGLLIRLVRNSTAIYVGDSAGSRVQATTTNMTSDNNLAQAIAFTFLDSPATTSATTYKVQICSSYGSNPVTINRSITDVDASDRARTASSITAMEIAA